MTVFLPEIPTLRTHLAGQGPRGALLSRNVPVLPLTLRCCASTTRQCELFALPLFSMPWSLKPERLRTQHSVTSLTALPPSPSPYHLAQLVALADLDANQLRPQHLLPCCSVIPRASWAPRLPARDRPR